MILIEETYKEYGYFPRDLSKQSHKRIVVSCNKCGKIRRSRMGSYRDYCISCAAKKPKSKEHARNISNGTKGEKNHGYGKHHSEEFKAKQRRSQNAFYSFITQKAND